MSKIELHERSVAGLHSFLLQTLPYIKKSTPILDIGCGTGAWLERLSNNKFTHLWGIDQNIEQFGATQATYRKVDLNSEDWNLHKRFGLITSIEVIEHLENPGNFFYHVAKYLHDDGYFLLTTPNIHSLECRLKFLVTEKLASFDDKGDPTHIYPVHLTCLQRILQKHSLKIVKQWGYPYSGSLVYCRYTQIISSVLKSFLPNLYQGDTLCLLIQKRNFDLP